MTTKSRWVPIFLFLTGCAAFASRIVPAHAVVVEPSPTPTARAKAVIRDASGAVKGTVYLTEYLGSGLLDQRIDVAGTVNGLAPGAHGLNLRSGDCASPGQHVDFSGASDPLTTHPRDEGDLPNVVADASGRASIRLTKVSNRFTLSSNPDLNVWAASGGPVVVAIDANATTSTTFDAAPVLCGVLVCDAGPCDSSIAPPPGPSLARVSVGSGGVQGDRQSDSQFNGLSADGRFAGFHSDASTWVSGDGASDSDVFLRDRLTSTTEEVSLSSAGADANNGSYHAQISADGRYVAFASWSPLVAGDSNSADIFVRDRLLGVTELVSVSSTGVQANGVCGKPAISADGRYVAFESQAANLVAGDTNGDSDVFVRDRQTGTTERVSVDSSGNEVFDGDVFIDFPLTAEISADGRFVTFESFANLLVPNDTNGSVDAFLRDRLLGITERISVDSAGNEGNAGGRWPVASADGRYVSFVSGSVNLVANDTNGLADIFVRDRVAGTTIRASVDAAGQQLAATSLTRGSILSADGRFVVFDAFNVVYVKDLQTGALAIVSDDRERGGPSANGVSSASAISADGRIVMFSSVASNLVAGDTNDVRDVFVNANPLAP